MGGRTKNAQLPLFSLSLRTSLLVRLRYCWVAEVSKILQVKLGHAFIQVSSKREMRLLSKSWMTVLQRSRSEKVNKVGKRRLLDIVLKESGEVTTMGSNEDICLHWNDFNSNIRNTYADLEEDKDFADVTLVCGDGQTDAHKVILSAGSPFFQKILKSNPHSKPLVYLKGVKFRELQFVLSFIYKGEATVAMADVRSFLAVAEDLEVKGLSKEYMSDGTNDQLGHQTQSAGPASLVSFPPTAKLNQQQTPDNNNIKAEAQPIKAEEQLGQLGGLVESGQAEASQELDYDDYNQNEDYNQYQDDPYQVQCSKCIPEI